MSALWHRALSVLSLMSRIPVRLRREPDYVSADWMIPSVGLAAGGVACAGAAIGLLCFRGPYLAATAAMTAQYLLFNLFHLDGLVDTADAAGVLGDDREKCRAVLKDPRLGTYGFFAGFLALAARLGATAAILSAGGAAAWGSLLLVPTAGRLAAMTVAASGTPAGGGGLGSALGAVSPVRSGLGYSLAAFPGALLWGLGFGPLAAAGALLAGCLVALTAGIGVWRWYRARIGGYTGDALGAAVELAELGTLLAAVVVLA